MKKKLTVFLLTIVSLLSCLVMASCGEEEVWGTYKFCSIEDHGILLKVGTQAANGGIYTENYATLSLDKESRKAVLKVYTVTVATGYLREDATQKNLYHVNNTFDFETAQEMYSFELKDGTIAFTYKNVNYVFKR